MLSKPSGKEKVLLFKNVGHLSLLGAFGKNKKTKNILPLFYSVFMVGGSPGVSKQCFS
jgi:hypothetical protein